LTIVGYILGHIHKGRPFLSSIHGPFASMLSIPIVFQLVLGIYLKLHIHEKSLRPYALIVHGILGKMYPILGWTQMLLGVLTFRGYCREDNLGKFFASMLHRCLIHIYFFFYNNLKQVNVLRITSWAVASLHMPRYRLSYYWLVSNGFVAVAEALNCGIPGVLSYSISFHSLSYSA
jgi:Domain of unknown function (DUF2427)